MTSVPEARGLRTQTQLVEKLTELHANEELTQHEEHKKEGEPENLVYANDEEEPELHFRTWLAVFAMCMINYAALIAITGVPSMLSAIAADLNGQTMAVWVPNAMSTVQVILVSPYSTISDLFQSRKILIVGSTAIAFIGAAIAPGATHISRLIAGQCLIGFGLAALPLSFTVASEILPTRWRPMAQALVNIGAGLGAISGPLIIGALVNADAHQGWRTFYWIQAGVWGAAGILLFVGYRPPKRHTRFDHMSWWQRVTSIDLIGCGLIAAALCLLLTGISLGGNQYAWVSAPTLVTLLAGVVLAVAFGLYEWRGTKTGIIHHDFFRNGDLSRTFTLCLPVAFLEGVVAYDFLLFNSPLTGALFETRPLMIAVRATSFWIPLIFGVVFAGWMATKFRVVREPLIMGFVLNMAGHIGYATIQIGDDLVPLFTGGLQGFGWGMLFGQIIAAVQLTSPHALIASASALAIVCRALGGVVFTAVYVSLVTNKMSSLLPAYLTSAGTGSGVPIDLIPDYVGALAAGKLNLLPDNITSGMISVGLRAVQQANADSIRVTAIIAAVFGAVGVVICWFMGDVKKLMNYHVDAPVEVLHAKHARVHEAA